MMKKAAAAALKYAGKKMAANASKKAKKGAGRVARAIKSNPQPGEYNIPGFRPTYRVYPLDIPSHIAGEMLTDLSKRLAVANFESGVAFDALDSMGKDYETVMGSIKGSSGESWIDTSQKFLARKNPYDQKGATFDLFGGESRALPKKVSEFHRPRVRVRGGTMTLAEGSPFKGRVARVNPAPRVVVQPLRVTLTAAEVKAWKADSSAFVSALLAKAAQQSAAWDHIEARGPGGRHLFDVVP